MKYLEVMRDRGIPIRFVSDKQAQLVEHYDFLVRYTIKVELKGMKAIHRGEPKQFARQWVEWQNVVGNIGWVRGQAVWVVFEEPDGYLCVRRTALEELVSKVDWCVFTTDKDYSLDLKAFSRSGRADRICLVQRADLTALRGTKKMFV
jgi:hypothetical protein